MSEHIIRLLKIFRVVQERFRLNPEKYAQIIKTICGLVRLRIGTFIL
nr:transposase family protein [Hydrocoleum sp. CS-953]